jgi:RNA polymerase sigma-70 factor (ECF subfamily)
MSTQVRLDPARSDEALMLAYLGGDERACRELFKRHGGPLLGMIRRRVRDDDQAHDILQQTFLNVHRARADFRTGSRFKPWLYAIATNLVREHYRRTARRRESSLDALDSVTPVEPATPYDDFVVADTVHRALDGLLDNQREVIELHWFEDLGYEEISERVGASEAAVRVRAHRGYERLRDALQVAA